MKNKKLQSELEKCVYIPSYLGKAVQIKNGSWVCLLGCYHSICESKCECKCHKIFKLGLRRVIVNEYLTSTRKCN